MSHKKFSISDWSVFGFTGRVECSSMMSESSPPHYYENFHIYPLTTIYLMCLKSTLYNVQVQVKTLGVPRNVQQFQPNFVTADTLSR